jgi:uroporphyrinogen-III synthase
VRVLVCRAAEEAIEFAERLAAIGVEPVVVPLISRLRVIDLPRSPPAHDWLLLTSAASAEAVAGWAGGCGKVAVVGPATAARAAALGFSIAVQARASTGASLVATLGDLTGVTLLYPCADDPTPATEEALRESGATVIRVVVYRNVEPVGAIEGLRAAGAVDLAALTSASTARRLAMACAELGVRPPPIAAIGPSTAAAAIEQGLSVVLVSSPHTVDGLVAAIGRWRGSSTSADRVS